MIRVSVVFPTIFTNVLGGLHLPTSLKKILFVGAYDDARKRRLPANNDDGSRRPPASYDKYFIKKYVIRARARERVSFSAGNVIRARGNLLCRKALS